MTKQVHSAAASGKISTSVNHEEMFWSESSYNDNLELRFSLIKNINAHPIDLLISMGLPGSELSVPLKKSLMLNLFR